MEKVWILFTNNLRLHDNTVLDAANKRGNILLPLYFHDTSLVLESEFNMRNIWPYRAKFLCESVNNLKDNLRNIDWDLYILRWNSMSDLVKYFKEQNILKVYVQQEVWHYEIKRLNKLQELLEKENISLFKIWDHTLVHKDDLDFHMSDMPQVFTQFRKSVEKNSNICDIIPTPKSIETVDIEESLYMNLKHDFDYEPITVDSRRAIDFTWWEDSATERLNHYFWETNSLSEYKKTRNWLIWADYSSKFSPYLALWCISPRYIYAEVKRYEKEVAKNSSTYWLIFELLWRDFFQFIFLQNPNRFFESYNRAEIALKDTSENRKLEKWKQGKLWVDFVDANMREFALTWFMSNRGRQVVASYLVNDLQVDWRLWAKYFESVLVDYDVASNWGNWAYVAWENKLIIMTQVENIESYGSDNYFDILTKIHILRVLLTKYSLWNISHL